MYTFSTLHSEHLELIAPLVYELNNGKIELPDLIQRFNEMKSQNYECVVIKLGSEIVGVTGLWYSTRHYAGKSVELDHVFIKPEHRGKGLGKRFMKWIESYLKKKGVKSLELNSYVSNYPSHKFYYNEGFEILGYHFLKSI